MLGMDCELDFSNDAEDMFDLYDDKDWEHVPISIPTTEMTPVDSSTSNSYFTSSRIGSQQTTSVTSLAGGLMSSAATSVASLWRGWGKSDK